MIVRIGVVGMLLALTMASDNHDHADLTSAETSQIIIRHDRPDSLYRQLGQRYASAVGHVEERVESTLVDSLWVVTAAHAVTMLGPFDAPYVMFGDERYEVGRIIVHPDWEGGWRRLDELHDVALLRLDRPVNGVNPVALYPDGDEVGEVVVLVGRGRTGTGMTGPGDRDDRIRGATNRIDGASTTTLFMNFDAPPDGTELEGVAGSGDSGGPAFLERGDTLYLVGIGSANTGVPDLTVGRYGSVEVYMRVSHFRPWIQRMIDEDTPSTVAWEPRRRLATAAFPDTPAGRLAADFFRAWASGSQDRFVDYFREVGTPGNSSTPEDLGARLHALRESLGAVTPFGWSQAGPRVIRVLLRVDADNTWRSFHIEATGDAQRIARISMKVEAPPREEHWRPR